MAVDLALQAQIKARDKLSATLRRVARVTRSRLGPAFARAARSARRLGSATRRMGGLVGRGALAIGGAAVAATAGIYKMVGAQAEVLDHAAKFSRRAGVTAQAYLELRHAAQLAGASGEEFDKAMEGASQRIGELRAGMSSTLATLLGKVNPAFLKQLKATKSNDEAIQLLLEGMGKLKDEGKRAAFAAAAFGRSGKRMSLLVENGTEALEEQRKRFRQLHGEVDAKALKSAEDYVDAQTDLKASISGVKTVIASSLMPVMKPMIERLTEWISNNREIIGQKVARFVERIGHALKSVPWSKVIEPFRIWGRLIKGVAGVLGTDGMVIVGVLALIGKTVGPIGKVVGLFGQMGKAANTALSRIASGGAMSGLMGALAGLGVAIGMVIANWRELTGQANTEVKVSAQSVQRARHDKAFQTQQIAAANRGDRMAQATLMRALPKVFSGSAFTQINAKLQEERDERARRILAGKEQAPVLLDAEARLAKRKADFAAGRGEFVGQFGHGTHAVEPRKQVRADADAVIADIIRATKEDFIETARQGVMSLGRRDAVDPLEGKLIVEVQTSDGTSAKVKGIDVKGAQVKTRVKNTGRSTLGSR